MDDRCKCQAVFTHTYRKCVSCGYVGAVDNFPISLEYHCCIFICLIDWLDIKDIEELLQFDPQLIDVYVKRNDERD